MLLINEKYILHRQKTLVYWPSAALISKKNFFKAQKGEK